MEAMVVARERSQRSGPWKRGLEWPVVLALFLVLFFFGCPEARGRTERLAMIEQGEILHVEREEAPGRLVGHDDGHRTAFDAFAEGDATAACEPSVRESLEHGLVILSGCVELENSAIATFNDHTTARP
jgi:hypothetical protein